MPRRLLLVAILLAPIMLAPMPAAASTPAAEAAMLTDAATACRTASGFKAARIVGTVGFSDTSAMTALLVTGTWRPRHMKGARGTMLCLYDRRARTAEAQEAKGWAAPPH